MIYQVCSGLRLSWLGMGNMRLPVNQETGAIDEAKALELIDYAYKNGVNYFDTAYRYHNGESEPFIGRALARYPRNTWYLASKMPGHMMRYENGKLEMQGYLSGETIASPAQVFEEQLARCGVEYFDFYLLHNLCETSYDFYTNEDLGVVDYLLEQKKAGRIRHLGFSAHGRAETIERFLNWRDCFEFVQIQLNYMDWSLQDAKRKYEVITAHGLPIVVMEPCRGGALANLGPDAANILKAARPQATNASWSFRYLQSLPNVKVVLSGMTNLEQLEENIALFSRNDPTTEEEGQLLARVMETMMDMVPCTACRYCCEGCPQGLDIPKLISMHNEAAYKWSGVINFTLDAMSGAERPSACIGCGACSALCPQNIDIPTVLGKFAETLREHGC